MARLITIIGNNASGKTTLTRALCRAGGFRAYLESHTDRPCPIPSKEAGSF